MVCVIVLVCTICSRKYDSPARNRKTCGEKCRVEYIKRIQHKFHIERQEEKKVRVDKNEPSTKVIAQIVGCIKVGKNEVHRGAKKCKCGNPLGLRTDDECVNCYSESLKGHGRNEYTDAFQFVSAKAFKL